MKTSLPPRSRHFVFKLGKWLFFCLGYQPERKEVYVMFTFSLNGGK